MRILFILCLSYNIVISQNETNNPLDIPIILSGTYGELRTNHFHSGIDIKTKGIEGLNVYSYDNGYVSRIKISHGGYGKAIYIKHLDGSTSVYAHLKKFSKKIEKIVKTKQYERMSYEIEFFPKENEISIAKNEIIALSGNTGGTTGPHLHFELRDKNQIPINPLKITDISILDKNPPHINNLFYKTVYSDKQNEIKIKRISSSLYVSDSIKIAGKIGFGIVTYDRHDLARNNNGVSKIETFIDDENILTISFDSISFDQTKHINAFIDYSYFKNNKKRIQKLFVENYNPLKLYSNNKNNGYLLIEENKSYTYEVNISDVNGNKSKLIVPIIGTALKNKTNETPKNKDFKFIDLKKDYDFNFNKAKVSIKNGTFYKNLSIQISHRNDTLSISKDTIALLKAITIYFNTDRYNDSTKNRLFIAKLSDNNKMSNYIYTTDELNSKKATTKSLGKFILKQDTINPSISTVGFKNNDWISNFSNLKIKIKDLESGIKSYSGWINDKWVLFELNTKKGVLTYDFNDKIISEAKNNLRVEVIDNVGNKSVYKTTFYRKPD